MRVKRAAALAAAAAATVAVPAGVHGGLGTGSTPHSTSTGATVAWAAIENPFGDGTVYQVLLTQPGGTTVATPGRVDLKRPWAVMTAAEPGVPNTFTCVTLGNPGTAQISAAYPASGFVNTTCNDGRGFDFYRITWSQASWWPQYVERMAGASDFDGHGASVQVPLPDLGGFDFGQAGVSGVSGSLRWQHSATDAMDVQMCGHVAGSTPAWVCRSGIGEIIVATDLVTSILDN